jgi:replicative DNA helicase
VKPSATARNQSREREVAEISAELKRLSKALDVPVVALAQLNTDADKRQDKRPMLSDLADSSGIEKESDTVSMIYRPGFYQREQEGIGEASAPEFEEAEILVEKNRSGERGTARVLFSGPYQRFDNLAEEGVF